MRRKLPVLTAAISLLVVSFALAAQAWEAEGGSYNCGAFIAFVHGRYNDVAALTGPGGGTGYYLEDDGMWHIRERNGAYIGNWSALGDPLLDEAGTWPGCRSFG